MTDKFNVAVVGATGAVGQAMNSILAERGFPINDLVALSSSRSAGKRLDCGDRTVAVQDLDGFDFKGIDLALFSAGASVSKVHAPRAVAAGCTVVDNTSQFRYDDGIPLVVPEVNPQALLKHNGIIANPNCSTIQMVVALKPIYDAVGITRINVCTYQAVSGAGQKGVDELQTQTSEVLEHREVDPRVMPKQIAFNAIPQIDVFMDNGYTREEMKMVWETRKIMEDENIMVNPTAVRIPVFYGHSEAVHLETRSKISAGQARALLESAPGLMVIDGHEPGAYPTAAIEAAHSDAVYVGRIREDLSHENGLNLWIVSDNVRKGAALNSVQISESLVCQGLLKPGSSRAA